MSVTTGITLVAFFLISNFAGSFGRRNADTNISHFQVSAETLSPSNLRYRSDSGHSISTNDYDDHSGGFARLHTPMHIVYPPKTTSTIDVENDVYKTYQPREDPKLYYQSEAYLKEINGQSVNKEVTYIYPGWEVVRAGDKYRIPKQLLRSRQVFRKPKLCVRCPHDSTLIAKVGAEKVMLQNPVLTTCSGRKAPRSVRLDHIYGPKFGTLLQQGSYFLIGRLLHKNETLRLCKIQVHVIIQSCPTPKYLISHCLDRSAPCNITCRDESMELQGDSAVVCGEDMKWKSRLPVCKGRNWCKPLTPTGVGKVSCRGAITDHSLGLSEGTRCRIRCPTGWQWFPKSIAVCRRGTWSDVLQCQLKKRNKIGLRVDHNI